MDCRIKFKKYSMIISGFHHQIMSGSLLLKELFKTDFDGYLQESSPSSSCIIVLENCMNNALNIITTENSKELL